MSVPGSRRAEIIAVGPGLSHRTGLERGAGHDPHAGRRSRCGGLSLGIQLSLE
jgi:hypothetical protein